MTLDKVPVIKILQKVNVRINKIDVFVYICS